MFIHASLRWLLTTYPTGQDEDVKKEVELSSTFFFV
jgi:hypothetical protein